MRALTAAQLTEAPLRANNRRAWPLLDLLGEAATIDGVRIVAHTASDQRFDVRMSADGEPVLVERDSGELYIGWIRNREQSLADAELPAQRIDDITEIELVRDEGDNDHEGPAPPVDLTLAIDGRVLRSLSPDTFASAADFEVDKRGRGRTAAIDLAAVARREVGGGPIVAHLEGAGGPATIRPPAPEAIPVVFLNRRGAFKFAWSRRSGELFKSTQRGGVTRVDVGTH